MSTIEDAIYNHLSNDSNITAIVSNRIFPLRIAQGTTNPNVMFYRAATIPDQTMASAVDFYTTIFDFVCYAANPKDARTLARAIRTSFEGYQGAILGINIWGVLYENELQLYDQDAELFRSSLEMKFLHS